MNHSSDHCKRTHTARTHATHTSCSHTAPHRPGGPTPKGSLGTLLKIHPPLPVLLQHRWKFSRKHQGLRSSLAYLVGPSGHIAPGPCLSPAPHFKLGRQGTGPHVVIQMGNRTRPSSICRLIPQSATDVRDQPCLPPWPDCCDVHRAPVQPVLPISTPPTPQPVMTPYCHTF